MTPLSMVLSTRTLRAFARAASVACALAATAAPAAAASWLEKNFYLFGPRYDAVLPACDATSALGKIVGRFAVKESRFWNSSLTIQDVSAVREVSFRPWMEGTVPRRFCTGKVLVSDGRWRTLHYSIIEDGGMIGASWGVEWCVVGLDRNWAYNPACKMAMP
jgi:hypothetical protein